jgi:hypothetical protein
MRHRKKVTWNAGQSPTVNQRPRMPVYTPEPDVIDADLKQAWNDSFIGQICLTNNHLACYGDSSYYTSNGYPHPILNPVADHDASYINNTTSYIPKTYPVIYLGRTYVDCIGTKSRIIKRPYVTVFFSGAKYLIADPNMLKPIFE